MTNKISIDIDGILNDYPVCWINYVNNELNTQFCSRQEIKDKIGKENYKVLKKLYRESDYKENLPINKEFVNFIEKIRKYYEIIIFTSRPIHDPNYPNLLGLTERWLRKNNVFFNSIYFKPNNEDILKNIPKILFHIEDEIKYAELIAKKGVKVFLSNQNGNYSNIPKIKNIILFDSIEIIEKLLLKEL